MCVAKGRTQHSLRLWRAGREKQDLSISSNWKSRGIEKAEYALKTPLQQAIDNVRSERSHAAQP